MKRISCIVSLIVIALLSSCKATIDIDPAAKPANVDPDAVGFSVYVNRGLQTKAGWAGVLTLDDLKDGTKANGFGVFAYYGNGALYNETSKPDFMYDQQVCFTDNNVWEYSPVKYWPNEFGEAASSEAADRLTFFAYAPFAEVTPSTGVVTDNSTTGIIGMSRNITAGDPVVMYSSSLTPGAGVDLCWGVAAEAFTSSVDGDNNTVAAGYPFLNVIKPKTGDHLKFEFNHALAQLNMQIDADINSEIPTDDGKTKIYVRSVTFNGFSMRGSLNLNSNMTDGPIWYDISGTGKLKREPVTVYDGRTDGMEGVETATDVSEKPADLNPVIVQSKPYGDAELSAGVTATSVNLFNGAVDAPVMVIPTPGVPVSVTIVYDVETEDSRLAGYLSDGVTHGSSVENKITKNITTDQGNMILTSGKKYVIKLHLGLTSVKFDAAVAVWDNTTYEGTADLPENTELLGTVTITDGTGTGTDPLTSLVMWKGETMATAPTVTVKDENDDPVTGFDVEWTSSNTDVATVAADGIVTPVAPGTATITVKASQDKKIALKSYTLYVNELTGIAVSSTTSSIVIGSTLPVKATLEINGGQGVYGDITNYLPEISWESSASDKISVDSPTVSTKDGDDYISTTTATAAATAAIDDQTVITASVGDISSNDLTLTCKNIVTGITLGTSTTTVWRYMGYTVPSVTVQGSAGTDLTDLATITWKVDDVPATVNEGVLPLTAVGDFTVTVTASYNDTEASDNITVHANEVTGFSVAPATITVQKGATTTLTASLTKTEYGDALAAPTISWSSGSTGYVTVSPATGTSTTATGVAAGSSTVTASVPADYMQSGVANSASSTVQCVTPSMTAFRGYVISPGILMRTVDSGTNEKTYSLTDGSNPFEPAVYYGNSTSLDKYFFCWNTLKTDLGADGNNIDADSAALPAGWILPSAGNNETSDWGKIVFGAPKSAITVGGKNITSNAKASVKVTLETGNSFGVNAGDYYGVLLLRDGTNIPDGYLNKDTIGGGTYTDNPLDETKFKELIEDYKCVFLSCTGYYWSSSWRDLSSHEGYYRAANSNNGSGYYLRMSNNGGFGVTSTKTSGNVQYYPVKLVKAVTDD
jgi:hypothetical protein